MSFAGGCPAAAGSVTYPFRYAPSSRLAGGPFWSQRKLCLFRGQDTGTRQSVL